MAHVQTPRTPEEKEAFLAFRRFESYLRDVIQPAVYSDTAPAEVRICQFTDPAKPPPVPGEFVSTGILQGHPFDPSKLTYFPLKMPCAWGPKWSTAWLHVKAAVPERFAGKAVVLRCSTGTEAQIWQPQGGRWVPRQGLDVNRDAYRPFAGPAGAGDAVELYVEAACNHPFGVLGFEWDNPEVHARWNSPTPGRIDRCELAVLDEAAWELAQHYRLAVLLSAELPFDSPRFEELMIALRAATIAFPDIEKATAALREAIARPAAKNATRCLAVGHAHLDTAWLWPLRETKRKVLRTFSNQLRNMERFPSYSFLASQAQHYAWVEERSPELFEQIRRRVAEGRWEPAGAMWVEPDINCISGESIIRQILHGVRYWESRFGERGRQRLLYLPDTFGFGSSLPQFMKLAGLDTFITNKLHWWQHTTFPHTTFLWRGIDGSTILAHNTPGQDYNATNTPKELRKGEATLLSLLPLPEGGGREMGSPPPPPSASASASEPPTSVGASSPPLWLQPFGFGDGGGGATDWSIRFAQLAANCDGLPRVELSSANAFCDALHDQLRRGTPFPTWEGELDMEIHRGTFTSQAWIKRANREAEEKLRLAEILLALNEPDAQARGDAEAIDRAWKLTLLNQFHDILPGSSIGQVYQDARRDHIAIDTLLRPLIDRELSRVAARTAHPAVFNPTSRPFSGVVEIGGEPRYIQNVPPLAAGGWVIDDEDMFRPVEVLEHGDGFEMTTDDLTAHVTRTGAIASLSTLATGPLAAIIDAASAGLSLYEDRPMMWDAWDIDTTYVEKPLPLGEVVSLRQLDNPRLRGGVEVIRRISDVSTATMLFTLSAGSPTLDIRFTIDWHERHKLLRFEIPTPIGINAACTHGVHLGHQTRPTHRDTPHQRARFEFPAQGWLDLSQPGLGLAVLTDFKFGFSCWQEASGHRIGISLLRAPTWPDENADQGRHEFTIRLQPHAGDWRAAGVLHQTELLRTPPFALPRPDSPTRSPVPIAPLAIATPGPAAVQITAFKAAEDSGALILRFHECHGAPGPCAITWNIPVARVEPVNILERPIIHPSLQHDSSANTTSLELAPFQIVTLAVTRA